MNIFVLSMDPIQAARFHCDKHVVKMILESAQMMSTAHWIHLTDHAIKCYAPCHERHPCTIWTAESAENYWWLWHLADELCREYTRRFGKDHATSFRIRGVLRHNPCPRVRGTPFALAMPDEFKTDDPVESYRRYYLGAKTKMLEWRPPAERPEWAL